MTTTKAKKQRKMRANAPLHVRHKIVSAHVAKALRAQVKHRSLPVRKGDEVIISKGEYAGKTGKVSEVDLKKMKVYIEGVVTKKVSGKEAPIPFDASNLIITSAALEDARRKAAVSRGK